jgi:hypothetical protein
MSEAAATPACDHYWAWVSPAGTSKSARICQVCHSPDPEWLNHTIEVDLGDACPNPGCVHCEFGSPVARLAAADRDTALREAGCRHVFPDGTRCTLTDHSAPGLAAVHGLALDQGHTGHGDEGGGR